MTSESSSANDAEPDATATADDSAATASESAEPETQADAAEESVEQLREALEQAQAEAEAQKDRALRAAAEAENVRKRTDRRIENAHKYALEKFVGDLLPAVDSFERAVEAAQKASEAHGDGAAGDDAASGIAAVAEGVQLSLKLLTEAMQKQGIETVDPLGAPFDPNLHEAMTMLESATAEPGSVMDVFQKGYTVNGRLVRAARVVVAKAPAVVAEAEPSAGEREGAAPRKKEPTAPEESP